LPFRAWHGTALHTLARAASPARAARPALSVAGRTNPFPQLPNLSGGAAARRARRCATSAIAKSDNSVTDSE
jgi:hypothetical protein